MLMGGGRSLRPARAGLLSRLRQGRDPGLAGHFRLAQAAAGIGPGVAFAVRPVHPGLLLYDQDLEAPLPVVPTLADRAAGAAPDAATAGTRGV